MSYIRIPFFNALGRDCPYHGGHRIWTCKICKYTHYAYKHIEDRVLEGKINWISTYLFESYAKYIK